ncbi:MAG: phosphatase PAP2 family protein [Bacteroidota bacterium]
MEYLLQLDESLFIIINRSWQNTFFDWLLPYWRNKYFWIPLYILLVVSLWIKRGKQSIPIFIFLLLSIAISDFTSSVLIKESVERIRPCNDPVFQKNVFLRAPCGSGYSFTSSHATNHFAIAVFLFFAIGQSLRKGRWVLLFWAVSIGFAQIYVGVHYPLDVICGYVLGGMIGFGFAKMCKRFSFSKD